MVIKDRCLTPGWLPTLASLIVVLSILCACSTNTASNSGVPQTTHQPTRVGSTGSTPGVDQKASPDQQVYRSAQFISDPRILDPALTGDINSAQIVNLIFTGLVTLDDQLRVRPQMAASWALSPDGLTWTFHLRPNLAFSDGSPLTAQDVAYSIDRALQPVTRSTVSLSYLGLLKDAARLHAGQIHTIIGDSIRTPDARTVVLVTSRRTAYFLDALTYATSYVVEKRLVDRYGAGFVYHLNEGGGAGPFRMTQYTPGQEIDFVPNSWYYGSKPQLQRLVIALYANDTVSLHAYQAGQLDMTPISPYQVVNQRQNPQLRQIPQLYTSYYTMNYLAKPFDNIHIRQAFALAVNRSLIAQLIWKGTQIPTYHIIPQGMPGYNAGLKGPAGVTDSAGNPGLAKQLLQQGLREEGWSSVAQMPQVTISYAQSTDADHEIVAAIQMWYDALGVRVRTNPLSFTTLLNQIAATSHNPHGLQFWGSAWSADYPDPQDWTSLIFGQNAAFNNMNYGQNASSDATQQQAMQYLMAINESNPDSNTRLQAYQRIEQQLVNDVAWMPMFQQTSTFLLKPYIHGLVFNATSIMPPDDWANVYILAH